MTEERAFWLGVLFVSYVSFWILVMGKRNK